MVQSPQSHLAQVEPGQTLPEGQHIAVPPMHRLGWQKAGAAPGDPSQVVRRLAAL